MTAYPLSCKHNKKKKMIEINTSNLNWFSNGNGNEMIAEYETDIEAGKTLRVNLMLNADGVRITDIMLIENGRVKPFSWNNVILV